MVLGIDPRCLGMKKIILALDSQNNQISLIAPKPFHIFYT